MRFTRALDIDVPAAAAWAVLADYASDPRWRAEVESMVPTPAGPAAVGTTTLEVARVLGSTFTTPGEVIAVDDGRSLTWRAGSASLDASGRRRVTALGPDRCRVELDYDLRLRGPSKVATPVLGWSFKRTARANLRRLAALLEGAYGRRASATSRAA